MQDSLIRIHFKCGCTSKIDSISVSEAYSEPLLSVSPAIRDTYRCGRGAFWKRFQLPSECCLLWLHVDAWKVLRGMMSSLRDEEHYPLAQSCLLLHRLSFMHQLLEFNWFQFCCYTVFVTLLMVMITQLNTSLKLIHIQRCFFFIFKV